MFLIFLHSIEYDFDGVDAVSTWIAAYVPVIELNCINEQIAFDEEYWVGKTTLISIFSKFMSYVGVKETILVWNLKK